MFHSLTKWVIATSLDEQFVAHYDELVTWAQKFVDGNLAAAEDLVQDTFVRLALRDIDLRQIADVRAYLFVTLRNVHLSQVRRNIARPHEGEGLLDFESVTATLGAVDNHRQRRALYEELSQIARFACLRKRTSKGASALILRFFQGYYPTEVARILGTTEAAIDSRLRVARLETRAFLADPNRLSVGGPFRGERRLEFPPDETTFLDWLRGLIFDTTGHGCLPVERWDEWYGDAAAGPVDVGALAHVVGCETCLEGISRRLGLPSLSDRDPFDTLGRGERPKGAGSGKAARKRDIATSLRTRLEDVFDERPKELRIAVNGVFCGSQVVSAELNEQQVRVVLPERIGFVEVFSEFGTCLLYMDVQPPPDGAAVQTMTSTLGHRRVTATLTFQDAAPMLLVQYEDPAEPLRQLPPRHVPEPAAAIGTWRWGWPFHVAWVRRTVLVVLFLACFLGAWSVFHTPTLQASEVLRRAGAAEASRIAGPGIATHRQLLLEERRPRQSAVLRRRVEVWQDGSRQIQVKRLYDEKGRVIAGVWFSAGGDRVVYEPGAKPRPGESPSATAPITVRDAWMLGPTVADFAAATGGAGAESASLAVMPTTFVLTYRSPDAGAAGVVESTLTVNQVDGLPVAATYLIKESDGITSFTFSETLSERVPMADVQPEAFGLDPSLISSSGESPRITPDMPALRAPAVLETASNAPVVDEAELDATYRLYRAGVWLGRDADITAVNGAFTISARVANRERASEVERVFADGLRARFTLDVDVTPDEALGPTETEAMSSIPMYPSLRGMFAAAPTGDDRDAAIRTFVGNVRRRIDGRRARLTALEALIARWPEPRLRGLGLEWVVSWQAMVQAHAEAIRRDTELLRVQLAPLSRMPASAVPSPRSATPVSSAGQAAELTRELAMLVRAQDAELSGVLQPCATGSCGEPATDRLIQSLAAVEQAASRFSQFYVKFGQNN